MSTDKQLELLSLFCGPGGLDEGFRRAGFRTSIAFDIDQDSVDTFRLNHPNSRTYVKDIAGLDVDQLDYLCGDELRPIGVIGGPPCQSFSTANVYQSEDDPRHALPNEYARLLRGLNARSPISFFLFENVPGLLGAKHLHRFESFKGCMDDAGFHISEQTLDARYFGVPQVRRRIFVVGINQQLHPGRTWTPPARDKNIHTVRSAIGDLPEPTMFRPGIRPHDIPYHPNHWCMNPKSDKFKSGNLSEGQSIGRSFRTLSWDKPSWAVAYGHREVHVHPNGHRRLSVYEAMRLQTFPHEYQLAGTLSAQIRLVSEAVPVNLAERIASSIRVCLGLDRQGKHIGEMNMNFHKTSFFMDSLQGRTFIGFSDGSDWNGWACPYFEKGEAERVLRNSESNGFRWSYDKDKDAFIVHHQDDEDTDAPEVFEGTDIEFAGQLMRVYPVGAYSWIWEVADKE